MSHTVVFDRVSRRIYTIDPPRDGQGVPILPEGISTLAVVAISDAEFQKFATAQAQFTISNDDRTIVATEVAPPAPTPQETTKTDITARATAALARLDAISANGGTYTAAQVRDAVVDGATIAAAMLRYLLARLA